MVSIEGPVVKKLFVEDPWHSSRKTVASLQQLCSPGPQLKLNSSMIKIVQGEEDCLGKLKA